MLKLVLVVKVVLTQIVLTLAIRVVNICIFSTLILTIFFFVLKMLFAFYVCYILYSNALKTTFIMDANSMNSDQTAPTGAV